MRDRPERVVLAEHLSYSIKMVAEIAGSYDDRVDQLDMTAARSMVDAFYVHIRLIAEFFLHATKKNDLGPATLGVDWRPPETEQARRLEGAWVTASQNVVHFGRARVVPSFEASGTSFRVGSANFRKLAEDSLTVYGAFVAVVLERAGEAEASADSGLARELRAVHSLLRGAEEHAFSMLNVTR